MKKKLAPGRFRFAVLATDTALFTIRDNELLVRMIRVKRPPHFPDTPGLPGGLILPHETAEEAAFRILREKAFISNERVYAEQLATFSAIDRDPRGRVVAVAYLALVPWEALSDAERRDTEETFWKPAASARRLAYDHDEMLDVAVKRLRSRATYTTLLQKLMPKEFTLTELEHAYESILGTELDKRNFRKKILKLKVLAALPKKRTGGRFRPAKLYRFTSAEVKEIEVI